MIPYIDFQEELFWYLMPRFIVFLFLISVGLSFMIQHCEKMIWQSFFKRLGKLAIAAMVISITTYLLFPARWIYFGTIHCIFSISICLIFARKFPKISGAIGIGILIIDWIFHYRIPWIKTDFSSLDYIPLFPWVGVSLLGVCLFHFKFHQISLGKFKILDWLSFLGKHAFVIYLVHQPLIYGSLFLLNKF